MRLAPVHAFTLIELVMVLVIVAIVVGITAPSLGSFITARKTADAASQIVALAHHARNASIAEGRTYRLVVDEQSGAYWVEAQDGASFASPGTALSTHYTLPSGITARWSDASWAANVVPIGISPGSMASGNSSIGNLSGASGGSQPGLGNTANPQAGKNVTAVGKDVKFYSDGRSDGSVLILTGTREERIELGAASESEPWRVVKDNQP